MGGVERGGREWAAMAAGLLVGLGLQAVGLVEVRSFLAWSIGVTLLLVASLVGARQRPPRWSGIAIFLAVLACWTALQLLPLPPSLIRAVSPTAHDVRAFGVPDLAAGWAPVSLDSPATATELAKLLAYCALAVICGLAASSRAGRSALVWSVVAAGGAFALSSLAHTLLAPDRLFGVYRPVAQTWGLVRAPLVNSNHIAGLFAAVAPLTFGLALGQVGRRRSGLLALGALEVALALATLSKGGAIASLGGLGLLAVGLSRRRDLRPQRLRREVMLALVAIGACLAYLAQRQFGQILAQVHSPAIGSATKLRVWADGLSIAGDYWATGLGRGAFVVAFPRHRSLSLRDALTFDHPENLVVQFVTEWGLIVGGAAVIVLGAGMLWSWRHRQEGRLRTGALAGLIALAVQNLADFSLEVPAVAALAIVLAVLASPERTEEAARPRTTRLIAGSALALALVGCLAGLGPLIVHHGFRTDAERLASILPGAAELTPEARSILDRHPADYVLPLVVGEWSARRGRSDSLRWLNRALYLNPRGGSVHFAIGAALARAGLTNQAMLELRMAHRDQPARGNEIARFAVVVSPRIEPLRRYVGTGRGSGARAINIAESLRDAGRLAEYADICEAISRRSEPSLRDLGLACLAEASRLLGARERALAAARLLMRGRPRGDLAVRGADVLARVGEPREATVALAEALRRDPEQPGLLSAAARLALKNAEPAQALELAQRLERTAGTRTTIVAEALVLQARARLAQSEPRLATALCERALSDSTDETEAIACLCECALERGDSHAARGYCADLSEQGKLRPDLEARVRAIFSQNRR